MPSITDTDSIIAAFLFAFARIAPSPRRSRPSCLQDGAGRACCAGATAGSAWLRRHRSMRTAHPHPPRHRGASDHDRWPGGRADRDRAARGRDHREGRRHAQRPTSAKTCNRGKLPIWLCQMTKFVLDRDTPATVVSLVAKASLRYTVHSNLRPPCVLVAGDEVTPVDSARMP